MTVFCSYFYEIYGAKSRCRDVTPPSHSGNMNNPAKHGLVIKVVMGAKCHIRSFKLVSLFGVIAQMWLALLLGRHGRPAKKKGMAKNCEL